MKKPRQNFDEWYVAKVAEVEGLPIKDVRRIRQQLIDQLENIHDLMREEGIKESRTKYLRGRRKFVTQLISYCNDRIKLFNLVAHNGASKNLALRFVQTAAELLPQPVFQRIYSLTQIESKEDESSIDEIRMFVEEFKKSHEKDGV